MNNEKYNHIIDKVYEKYAKDIQNQRELRKKQNEIIEKIISIERMASQKEWVRVLPVQLLSREEFINVCKIDTRFSERWRLKIEERELSERERYELVRVNGMCPKYSFEIEDGKPVPNKLSEKEWYDNFDIPSKLITVTYNNETIEIYE